MLQSLSKQDFLPEVPHTYVHTIMVCKNKITVSRKISALETYKIWLKLVKSFTGRGTITKAQD